MTPASPSLRRVVASFHAKHGADCRETDPGVEMCAKASKYGAARPTEEVGHYEHRVQPAAGLGTQRVDSCLVADGWARLPRSSRIMPTIRQERF